MGNSSCLEPTSNQENNVIKHEMGKDDVSKTYIDPEYIKAHVSVWLKRLEEEADEAIEDPQFPVFIGWLHDVLLSRGLHPMEYSEDDEDEEYVEDKIGRQEVAALLGVILNHVAGILKPHRIGVSVSLRE